jgi:hypothetical protein
VRRGRGKKGGGKEKSGGKATHTRIHIYIHTQKETGDPQRQRRQEKGGRDEVECHVLSASVYVLL